VRARVLIVDDEVTITNALRRLLGHDHDVTVFNDPVEAMALVRSGHEFDVILCDLMMPRLNGVQLHRELSEVAPAQVPALVLMTGGSVPRDAVALIASGVPSLCKPFGIDELRAVIAQVRSSVPGQS
jgi:DNA-binding response OmpR family regulator